MADPWHVPDGSSDAPWTPGRKEPASRWFPNHNTVLADLFWHLCRAEAEKKKEARAQTEREKALATVKEQLQQAEAARAQEAETVATLEKRLETLAASEAETQRALQQAVPTLTDPSRTGSLLRWWIPAGDQRCQGGA